LLSAKVANFYEIFSRLNLKFVWLLPAASCYNISFDIHVFYKHNVYKHIQAGGVIPLFYTKFVIPSN